MSANGEIPIETLLQHAGWLRALAARLVRDPHGAEDLVQETWIAALEKPPEARTPLGPWLARVLRNLARNARRGEERRHAREAWSAAPELQASADRIALEAEGQRLLAEAVAALEEPLRAVVVLRYFRGLDSAEIARELGIPAGTVRWRLARALEELRARLDRHAGGREAWLRVLAPIALRAPARGALVAAGTIAGAATALVLAGLLWQGFAAPRVPAAVPAGRSLPAGSSGTAPDEGAPPPSAGTRHASTSGTRAPAAAPTPLAEAEISGVVLVDGRPPASPLELHLSQPRTGRAVPASTATRSVPEPSWTLRTSQGKDGSFRMSGMPEGWTGRLSAEGMRLEDGARSLEVRATTRDLVLRLRSLPAIRGVLVDPAGVPLPGVDGLAAHAIDSAAPGGAGDSTTFTGFTTDEHGAFRVPLEDPPEDGTGRAWLTVELDAGFLQLESASFDAGDGIDLGTLRLGPVRTLELVVRDRDGLPIPGAQARLRGPLACSRSAPPTDVDGWTRLDFVPVGHATVRVDALRHRTVDLVVDGLVRSEVVLAPATGATVRWEAVADEPELHLTVIGDQDDPGSFAVGWSTLEAELERQVRAELGASRQWSGRRLPDGTIERDYRPDASGEVHLGLEPGACLRLELREPAGRVRASAVFQAREGRWEELVLVPGP